jgi:hypothetical protein
MRVCSHQLTCVEGTQGTRSADIEIAGVTGLAGLVMNLPYVGAIAQVRSQPRACPRLGQRLSAR